ncbi:hypothetical protein TNCV_547321 [Trichonephila clavipes]|nr:hypothetical protein TNCV_547321 [Trichonephila clavipes]
MKKIRKAPVGSYCPIVFSEEFIAVDNDNMCSASIMAERDILEFVQRSKTMIHAYSGNENERNNVHTVPTSSELRNVIKRMAFR